ncbi:helix-turn-helix domain-containing protein [Streptomyces prunicolor]|uniref:helix-turn-helix domain-containing protein n=1 Tax=Streptomyces prunicolor TaxID=67348 RepID=UPI00037A1AA6|nr:helix-turn-helix domain-containing protein [Streptomyces prunicolor]
MPESAGDDLAGLIGTRVEWHRRRRGLSRRELSTLVGHTERWLSLLEQEGRGALRLDNLIDLARALRIADLSSLVGRRFSATALDMPEHPAVPEVRKALTNALLASAPEEPPGSAASLERRIRHAWDAWHVSRTQNTQLGLLLPGLLRDATALTRTSSGTQRRRAYAIATSVHLLGQRYAYGVRAMELAAKFTDRALSAAVTSEDAYLMALAGWGSAMTSLTAQQPQDAEETALAALHHVARPVSVDEQSLRGALLLFAAMGAAGDRRAGDAWRHWEAADRIATNIGGHVDMQTMFGATNVGIYAVAVNVECGRSSAAVASAAQLNPRDIPSTNRRAQHFIDLARSHFQAGDHESVRGALLASERASKETIAFNPEGRQIVSDIIRTNRSVDDGIAGLAERLGLR